MDREHKRLLENNRDILSNIPIDDLKPLLVEYKIFNKYMWNDITTTSDVFDALQYRGPKAFQNIIEILKKANYNNEANILENHTLVKKTDDSNLFYKMSSKYLGFCLIINNVEFEKPEAKDKSVAVNEVLKDRLGSDTDAESLRNFFESIDFVVKVHRNKKAIEMKACLKEFSKRDFADADSLIVIILSHGGEEMNKDIIYGTDHDHIYKSDVWDVFNNEDCESLQNKPKIFFFICCRGRGMEYGVAKCLPRESVDSSNVIMPSYSDIFIVHSTLPQKVSVRDDDTGSFFCQAFVAVLKKYYKIHDLETIIKLVNKDLQNKVSKIYRTIQVAHVESLAGTRKILFHRTCNS